MPFPRESWQPLPEDDSVQAEQSIDGASQFTIKDYELLAEQLSFTATPGGYLVSCSGPSDHVNAAVERLNQKFELNVNITQQSYLSETELQQLRAWFYRQKFGDAPLVTKTIRFSFLPSFLQTTIQSGDDTWHDGLRIWRKKAWTIHGNGVEARRRKQPLYLQQEKAGFSKHQSVCLITPKAMFPVYAQRRPHAAGFIFPPDSFLLNNRLYPKDTMTTNRSYDLDSREAAIDSFRNQAWNQELFGDVEKFTGYLTQKAVNGVLPQSHTDVFARLKVTDSTLIGIFNDCLLARAHAIFIADLTYQRKIAALAAKSGITIEVAAKIAEETNSYPPIVYYCEDSLRVFTPYTEAQKQQNLEEIRHILHTSTDEGFKKNLELMLALPDTDSLRARLLAPAQTANEPRLPLIWVLILSKDRPAASVCELLATKLKLFDDVEHLIEPLLEIDLSTLPQLQYVFSLFVRAGCIGLVTALLQLNTKKPFLKETYLNEYNRMQTKECIVHDAIGSGNQAMVELILDYPHYIFERNRFEAILQTPLYSALDRNEPRAFRRLLRDERLHLEVEGPYCLLAAVEMGVIARVRDVIQMGIHPDQPLPTPRSYRESDSTKYDYINNYIDYQISYYNRGYTALMFAAVHDHCEIAEILLQAGANLTVIAKDGYDAISLAAIYRSFDTLKLLLQHLPQVENPKTILDRVISDNKSILQLVWQGHYSDDIVELLLDAGADDTIGYRQNKANVEKIMQMITAEYRAATTWFAFGHTRKAIQLEAALSKILCSHSKDWTVTAALSDPTSELSRAVHASRFKAIFSSCCIAGAIQSESYIKLEDESFKQSATRESYQPFWRNTV